MNAIFTGSGPGPQTADGCSVELYRRLPYRGELEPLRSHLATGATVLELGCGSGRLTRVLLDWGCRVTAVDDSADMLRHMPAPARTVLSSVQALALAERFDAVLLASCLINHVDAAVRQALVACAARHLPGGGQLLMERHDPQRLATVMPGPLGPGHGVTMTVEAAQHAGVASDISLRYEAGGQVWRHRFTAAHLDQAAIERLLADAGFGRIAWVGDRARWLIAERCR